MGGRRAVAIARLIVGGGCDLGVLGCGKPRRRSRTSPCGVESRAGDAWDHAQASNLTSMKSSLAWMTGMYVGRVLVLGDARGDHDHSISHRLQIEGVKENVRDGQGALDGGSVTVLALHHG
jgi:hypothetical protein